MNKEKLDLNKVVAVIGGSGIFPGSKNIAYFWDFLCEKKCGITELPESRQFHKYYAEKENAKPGKIYTKYGGTIKLIEYFDTEFFEIDKNQIYGVDPQTRLIFQASWHALENANIPPHTLNGSNTGVFIGKSSDDYIDILMDNIKEENLDPYLAANLTSASVAGRISYFYNTKGPAFVINTETSSSLTAIHEAMINLSAKRCDLAIIGAVNVILSPKTFMLRCISNMITPDPYSHIFDKNANGYTRGEGVGVIILKTLRKALEDGDKPQALILGGAMNECGHGGTYAAPDIDSQVKLINYALKDAGITKDDILFYEAHGTGTPLGDTIELTALGKVFNNHNKPLYIGSVKSNIGHLEAAAGMASFIKAVLSLKTRTILPHIHCDNPVDIIESIPAIIPTEKVQIDDNQTPIRCIVTSLGLTGTNVSLVLEEYIKSNETIDLSNNRQHQILTMSAKTLPALKELFVEYYNLIESSKKEKMTNICLTSNLCRTHHLHRLAFPVTNHEDLLRDMTLMNTQIESDNFTFHHNVKKPRIAFIFPSKKKVDFAKILFLYNYSSVFKNTFNVISDSFNLYFKFDMLNEIKQLAEKKAKSENIAFILFTVELATAQLFKSYGITPRMVFGCGVGELAAACFVGNISVKDAARFIAFMYHNKKLADTASLFNSITFKPTTLDTILVQSGLSFYSGDTILPKHWKKHKTDEFRDDVKIQEELINFHCEHYLTVGGDLDFNTELEKKLSKNNHYYSSIYNGHPMWETLTKNIAKFYELGCDIDWQAFNENQKYNKTTLPLYPFQLKAYVHPDIPLFHESPISTPAENTIVKKETPITSELIKEKIDTPTKVAELFTSQTPQEFKRYLMKSIDNIAKEILNLDENFIIDHEIGFVSMGFDSLGAIAFKNKIELSLEYSIKLPSTLIFDLPTMNDLSNYIYEKLTQNFSSNLDGEKTIPENTPQPIPNVLPLEEIHVKARKQTVEDKGSNKDDLEAYFLEKYNQYVQKKNDS